MVAGLNYAAAEDTSLWPSTPFPEQKYGESSYQIAFWFQFSDVLNDGTRNVSQMLIPVNQRAIADAPNYLAFMLSAGRDPSGTLGVEVRVPNATRSIVTIQTIPTTHSEWHQCVAQYTSASSLTAMDAGLRVYIDPVDASATPALTIDPSSNQMNSSYGDGPLGRYSFGAAVYFANPDGPEIWMDRIGSWDGFGVAGKNDLQSAIDFFYPMASIHPVAASVAEADEGITPINFRVYRKEETGISAVYDWAVTDVGSQSAGVDDFDGGAFPSGQVTFAPGENVKNIQVMVKGDAFVEEDESFQVTLTSSDGHARVNSTAASATATIADDDDFNGAQTYAEWASTAFATASPTEQDNDDNPDNDSWPNAFEFLFGMNPEQHDLDPITMTTNETTATITYPRDPDVPRGTEILEYSTTMDSWIPTNPISTAVQSQAGETDMVTIAVPLDANVRLFYRLRIP